MPEPLALMCSKWFLDGFHSCWALATEHLVMRKVNALYNPDNSDNPESLLRKDQRSKLWDGDGCDVRVHRAAVALLDIKLPHGSAQDVPPSHVLGTPHTSTADNRLPHNLLQFLPLGSAG
jgi:hypothetical protein